VRTGVERDEGVVIGKTGRCDRYRGERQPYTIGASLDVCHSRAHEQRIAQRRAERSIAVEIKPERGRCHQRGGGFELDADRCRHAWHEPG
jgi:hypothetical protein